MEKSIEYLPYVDDDQVDEMIVQKKTRKNSFSKSQKFLLFVVKMFIL